MTKNNRITMLVGGLLVGTAFAFALHSARTDSAGEPIDRAQVEKIVEEYIRANPKVILESVQEYQKSQMLAEQNKQNAEIKGKIAEIEKNAIGSPMLNPDGDITVVEFFDYNCGACKMMYRSVKEVLDKDKKVRFIFKELPIFGPVSDANAKVALAVHLIAPDKYWDFHQRLFENEGQLTEAIAIKIATDLGIDEAALTAKKDSPEVVKLLESDRALAQEIKVQGTPALIIGDEFVPGAMPVEEFTKKIEEHRAKKK